MEFRDERGWGMFSGSAEGGAKPENQSCALTTRQLECLAWVRAGKSSNDIAGILGISVHVVNEHIGNACRRLGVRTRTQGVVKALLEGLLQ